MPTNASLYSTKQAVVDRTNFTLDVTTTSAGLPISEQQRLNGWFKTMDLRYGDRISIETPDRTRRWPTRCVIWRAVMAS